MSKRIACRLCPFDETWSTEDAALAAGEWHLHDQHPAEWRALNGAATPATGRPVEYGDRV